MQQLKDNLFLLPVELPGSPLRQINCYLIRGKTRHLLIDTAFNSDVCEQSLLGQLEELGVSLEDTDLFITHLHVDHSGLIGRLKREGNRVYASAADKVHIDEFAHPERWGWIDEYNARMGVPTQYALGSRDHVAHRMCSGRLVEILPFGEGDRLDVGDYHLEVLELPGHTPGHLGLWERDRGILFSGDHILADISPNITAWDMDHDYLRLFRESLLKVKALPVKAVFPAHRHPPADCNARIDQLLLHHDQRIDETVAVLREAGRPMSIFAVSLAMKWHTKKPLLESSPQQLWFACTETWAHLQALRFEGRVTCTEADGVLLYSL